jgi:hypothetical protein
MQRLATLVGEKLASSKRPCVFKIDAIEPDALVVVGYQRVIWADVAA